MANDVENLIRSTVEGVRPLYVAYTHAMWESATTGAAGASKKEQEAQAALMRFWADPERHALAKRLDAAGAARDPIEARQLRLIYLSAAKESARPGRPPSKWAPRWLSKCASWLG